MKNSIFTFTSGNNIISIENTNGLFVITQKQGENDTNPIRITSYTEVEAMNHARRLMENDNGEG